MKKIIITKYYLAAIIAYFGLLAPRFVRALDPLIPVDCTTGLGDKCGVCQLIGTGINFAQILLGLAAGLALVLFVWGGFNFVISGGSAERIKKGKEIMIQTSIGILIMLLAWTIINFTIITLTQSKDATGAAKVYISNSVYQNWAEYCKTQK